MLLAELTATEWGAVIAAGATGLGTVIAAIFTGWKYIQMENNKTMLALEKIRAANLKVENTRLVKEQAETIKEQDQLIKERSQEVHDVRDKANGYMLEKAVYEERFRACDEDRAELRRNQIVMAQALNQHGISVPVLSTDPPGQGNGGNGSNTPNSPTSVNRGTNVKNPPQV